MNPPHPQPAVLFRGQIWWSEVPYKDADGSKERPVIVLGWSPLRGRDDHNILVVPTSTFGGDSSKARGGDLASTDPNTTGMAAKGFIRCRRLMTLGPEVFHWDRGPLGSLGAGDLDRVWTEVERLFAVAQFVTVPRT